MGLIINILKELPLSSILATSSVHRNLLILVNNLVASHPCAGQGQPTDCWSHFHLSTDRGEKSSNLFRSDVQ